MGKMKNTDSKICKCPPKLSGKTVLMKDNKPICPSCDGVCVPKGMTNAEIIDELKHLSYLVRVYASAGFKPEEKSFALATIKAAINWCRDWDGKKFPAYILHKDYRYIEPKKTRKVLLAPALYFSKPDCIYTISNYLFENKHLAENWFGKNLVCWPSHPDDLKEYEVPEVKDGE